ncbi:MAG: M48 family metalloprotease, partial [Pirellulales bacterium]|nr:M48 family metalloprotease [Pirellulales bacterium]
MNPFELIPPHISTWIVTALAHLLWQGVFLAALIAAVAQRLGNRSAQARYLVFCLGLFVTAACLPLSLWMLAPVDSASVSALASAYVTVENRPPVSQATADENDTVIETFVPMEAGVLDDQERLLKATMPLGPTPSVVTPKSSWAPASRWIVAVYAIGIFVMSLRLLAGLYGSQRLRTTATPIDDPRVREILARFGEQFRGTVLPVVAYSARVTAPLVVGVLKPAILLPTAILSELTPEQVESLLLHELAHIRRYDHLVNLLQRIVETVLFFHPAVWWLSHKVSMEREHCCDDLAIAWGSEPCSYAESLVRVSELRYQAAGLGAESATTLAATGGRPTRLRGRVLRVLGMPLPGPNPGLTRRGLAILLVLTCSVAAVVGTWANDAQEKNPNKHDIQQIVKLYQNKNLVGTWSAPPGEGDRQIVTFNQDGTYVTGVGEKGKWKLDGDLLTGEVTNGPEWSEPGSKTKQRIVHLNVKSMTLVASPPRGPNVVQTMYRAIDFHGVMLHRFYSTTDPSKLPELWEESPRGSGSYQLQKDVRIAYTHIRGPEYVVIYHRPDLNKYFVEYDQHFQHHELRFYGPYEGD